MILDKQAGYRRTDGRPSFSLSVLKRVQLRVAPHKSAPRNVVRNGQSRTDSICVVVCSGLTSLSTILQSYHDGVWLRQGAQCSLL